MLAFRLSYGADDTPKWFTHLVEVRPALVAEVLIDYASIALKSKMDFVSGIYPLAHDPAYAAVAAIAAPSLLAGFPLRSKSSQLSHLEYLLKAALIHSREALAVLVEKKTATKSMDVAQKVYWLTACLLYTSRRHPVRSVSCRAIAASQNSLLRAGWPTGLITTACRLAVS